MASTQKSELREQPLCLVDALRLRTGVDLPKKTIPKHISQKTLKSPTFGGLSIFTLN